MKKLYPLFLLVLMSLISCSKLSPIVVKSKYTADEVLRKLEFAKPYTVNDSTPVIFGEKIVEGDFKPEDYIDTPWQGAKKGREFIVVEYSDRKQKTDWGYLYQVYLWRDRMLPFYVNRGDGMAMNLCYNGTSQPYYRVNYSRDLHEFKYPTLVKPNEILKLVYVEEERVIRKDRVKVSSYVFKPNESSGVELIERTEKPWRGSLLITYKIKVIADDAWIAMDKTENTLALDCRDSD